MNAIDRRTFMKAAGAAGAGAFLFSGAAHPAPASTEDRKSVV